MLTSAILQFTQFTQFIKKLSKNSFCYQQSPSLAISSFLEGSHNKKADVSISLA